MKPPRTGLLLLCLAACSGRTTAASTAPPPPPESTVSTDTEVQTAEPAAAPQKLQAPASQSALQLTPLDVPTYERAHQVARVGRLREARRLFGNLVVAYPDRQRLIEDFNATQTMIAAEQKDARASLEASELQLLPAPPTVYTVLQPASIESRSVPKLSVRSKKKNKIIDEAKWFQDNDLTLPRYFIPPTHDFFFFTLTIVAEDVLAVFAGFGLTEWTIPPSYLVRDVPTWLPLAYGTMPMTQAIDSSPYTIAIYGGRIVAVFDSESTTARSVFDFGNYTYPPASETTNTKVGEGTLTTPDSSTTFTIESQGQTIAHSLTWALAKDGTLFVQHTNSSSAKDNKAQNAYLSAVDLEKGTLAWRSAPMVSNAQNFALVQGGLIAGYGFTKEPDFVYVLDAADGSTQHKVRVPASPEAIVPRGNDVFVRTYHTDLVFSVSE